MKAGSPNYGDGAELGQNAKSPPDPSMADPGGLGVRGVFRGDKRSPPHPKGGGRLASRLRWETCRRTPSRVSAWAEFSAWLIRAVALTATRSCLAIGLNSLSAFCSRQRRLQGLPAGPPHRCRPERGFRQVATAWLAQPTAARRATRRHGRNRMTGSRPYFVTEVNVFGVTAPRRCGCRRQPSLCRF